MTHARSQSRASTALRFAARAFDPEKLVQGLIAQPAPENEGGTVVDLEDVSRALPPQLLDPAALDALLRKLADRDVAITVPEVSAETQSAQRARESDEASDTSVTGAYLRQIAAYSLLSADDEVRLGREIAEARAEALATVLLMESSLSDLRHVLRARRQPSAEGDEITGTAETTEVNVGVQAIADVGPLLEYLEDHAERRARLHRKLIDLDGVNEDRTRNLRERIQGLRDELMRELEPASLDEHEVRTLVSRAQRRLERLSKEEGPGDTAARRLERLALECGLPAPDLRTIRQRLLEVEARRRRAKQAMVQANLRLVVSLAKRFRERGLPFLDIVQEGNTGLMRAVEKYDWRRGFRFSTYAAWWISQAMRRALTDQSRTIRVPSHVLDARRKLLKTSSRLSHELGRRPEPVELAGQMGLERDRVDALLLANHRTIPIDAPVSHEQDLSLLDVLADEDSPSPVAALERAGLEQAARAALDMLPDKERRVLELRFGFAGELPHTLEEIGQELDVTRERIRQIEASALARLRKPNRSKMLQSFVD